MKRVIFFSTFLLGLTIFFLNFSLRKKPILIGFSAQLTGNQAELGVQERNGVQLAVEKINSEGGINGRNIKLLIRDDYGIPEEAKKVDKELIDAGVVAIIGHSTTMQTMTALEVTNPAKVVLISPTTSTPLLTGIDDYFFRVCPSFKDSAEAFAEYVYRNCKEKNIAVIYDSDNLSYSKTYSDIFSATLKSVGGNLTKEISFSSKAQTDFLNKLEEIKKSQADGLLIIASDIDTALIAQKLRLMDCNVNLYGTAWANTSTLINNGGKAVEGMLIEQYYIFDCNTSRFNEFKNNFKSRFGNDASFGSTFGYDTVLVLKAALEKTGGKADGLKDELCGISKYEGALNTFNMDNYGDTKRDCYLSVVSNRKFNMITKIQNVEVSNEQ